MSFAKSLDFFGWTAVQFEAINQRTDEFYVQIPICQRAHSFRADFYVMSHPLLRAAGNSSTGLG